MHSNQVKEQVKETKAPVQVTGCFKVCMGKLYKDKTEVFSHGYIYYVNVEVCFYLYANHVML